jgi:MFS family permease
MASGTGTLVSTRRRTDTRVTVAPATAGWRGHNVWRMAAASPPIPRRAPFSAVLGGPHRWMTVTILSATVIGSMDSYIVNTSMPRVLAELGQPEFYAWVASAFVLAQIVGLAIAGAWKDRSGLRTPFLLTVSAFGVSSLLCAFAPSMGLLVLARAIQGLAGGGLNALGFAAAAGYPEALRLRIFSLISGVWGVIALGAPLLGGLITDTLGWRWIFLVNMPLCALVLVLGWHAIAATSKGQHRRALPIARAVLLATAVGGLTAAPSARNEIGFVLLGIGVLAAAIFARAERRAAVPVIPLDTWRNRGPLGSSMFATLFYTGAYVGSGVFLPLYLVQVRGESTTQAGLVLSVGGSMWTIGSIIASTRSYGHWPTRMVVGGALLIALAGLSIAVQALIGDLPLGLIYITGGAAGFGVGLRSVASDELGNRVRAGRSIRRSERRNSDDAHARQRRLGRPDGRAAECYRHRTRPVASVDRGDLRAVGADRRVARDARPAEGRAAHTLRNMTTAAEVQDQQIVLNGLRLHYLDWGNEPAQALVCLHGFTSHTRAANARPPDDELRHRVEHGLVQRPDGKWTFRYDVALRNGSGARRTATPEEVEHDWASLVNITCPTLLVRGALSDVLDADVAQRMVQSIPDCRLVEVADSGHSVPLDNPRGFLQAVRGFL